MVHTSRSFKYASYEEFRDHGMFSTEANCMQFLYDMKILRTHQQCSTCRQTMKLKECATNQCARLLLNQRRREAIDYFPVVGRSYYQPSRWEHLQKSDQWDRLVSPRPLIPPFKSSDVRNVTTSLTHLSSAMEKPLPPNHLLSSAIGAS